MPGAQLFFIALVGPSGCGKSTLLELIAGLESISTGEIRIDGQPVTGPNPDAVMVFQEHALFPWLNVEDNVAFGLKKYRMARKKLETNSARKRDRTD